MPRGCGKGEMGSNHRDGVFLMAPVCVMLLHSRADEECSRGWWICGGGDCSS